MYNETLTNKTLTIDPLTDREYDVVRCIAKENYSARETAAVLCVINQCVANHLQTIYDKLGIKRNLQALTKWYFTVGEGARKIGAAVLLLIFSFEVANMDMDGRLVRSRARRRSKDDIEVVDMEGFI